MQYFGAPVVKEGAPTLTAAQRPMGKIPEARTTNIRRQWQPQGDNEAFWGNS